MIIDAEFKEIDHSMNADFGVVYIGGNGNKGEVDYSLIANALKGNASGSAVAMTDVSPFEHIMDVKARSKNLFTPDISTVWLCKADVAEDGMITLIATATSGSAYATVGRISLKKGVHYTCNLVNATNMGHYYFRKTGTSTTVWESAGSKFYTPTEDVTVDLSIYMKDITAETATCYVQLEEGAKLPTTYSPHVADVTKANVLEYGKNLFNPIYTATNHTIKMQNGIVAEHNQAYTVSFDKECSEIDLIAEFADGTTQTKYIGFSLMKASFKIDGNKVYCGNNFGATQTFDNPIVKFSVSAYGSVANGWEVSPLAQLEFGTEVTSYEPYKEPTTHSISADGTVEGVASIYPTTTLVADTEGVVMDVEYNRDINKAFAELVNAIISIGGNV